VRSPTNTTPTRSRRWKTWRQAFPGVGAAAYRDLGELYDIEFDEDLDVDTVGACCP